MTATGTYATQARRRRPGVGVRAALSVAQSTFPAHDLSGRTITIKAALNKIQAQDYVLPAIQREFVWKPDQICRLFDSLMQGYPIGSFLFWLVEPEHSQDFTWYGIIKDYHQRDERHCPVLDLPNKALVAILDGQQRLTALNIGLRGSYAEKEPRMWWNNPGAFPIRRLYLNLLAGAGENENGLRYDFRFLTKERAEALNDGSQHWYMVSDILKDADAYHVTATLQDLSLGNNREAGKILSRLHQIVHTELTIPYFEETQQDLDKVLNIFIRVNSGGTVLSYSDLLLSIATASWKGIDARLEIHGLVDDLNSIRNGFTFSKDMVLKAGLMLADIPSVAFRVTNFNATNMATLQANWSATAGALRVAAELLGDFGFSGQNLSADSVILPIAYYLHKRDLSDSYRESPAHAGDRRVLHSWILKTLLKTGFWGGSPDTLQHTIRAVIRENGATGFPAEALEQTLERAGRSLRFTDGELQDLLESSYGDKRTFALLSLLFPHCNLRNLHHIDHVFPRKLFHQSRLRTAGVPDEKIEELKTKADQLPNLQLLEGLTNLSKSGKMPAEWLKEEFISEYEAQNYLTLHELGALPTSLADFEIFFENRRNRLAEKLKRLLGISASDS